MLLEQISGLMNRRTRIGWCGLILGLSLLVATEAGAQTPPPAARPAAQAAAKPKGPPPDPLPDSVPDNVNPFADPKNMPKPLNPNGTPLSMSIDVEVDDFDGLGAMLMHFHGPDFEWITTALDDWVTAPAGADESIAFVYKNPDSRAPLARALPRHGFDAGYQSGQRSSNTSPRCAPTTRNPSRCSRRFPQATTKCSSATRFSGFIGQGFKYAFANPLVLIYHVWIVDLNHNTSWWLRLASPPAMFAPAGAQAVYTLGGGHVRQGPRRRSAQAAAGSVPRPPAPRG